MIAILKQYEIPMLMGWIFAPFIIFAKDYLVSDWQFVINMLVVIAIDTIFGIMWAYKCNVISSKEFGKLFSKITTYLLILIATHNITHYTVGGMAGNILTWLDSFVYATIMAREALSIFEKTALLGYFKPPQWIVDKLKLFNETGKSDKNV